MCLIDLVMMKLHPKEGLVCTSVSRGIRILAGGFFKRHGLSLSPETLL